MAKNDVGTIIAKINSDQLEPFAIGLGKSLRTYISRDVNSLDDFLRVFMEGSTSFDQNTFFALTRLRPNGVVSFSYRPIIGESNIMKVQGSLFDNGQGVEHQRFHSIYDTITGYFASKGNIESQYILQEPSQRL